MKFLIIVKNLYNFPGGAERSLLTLMKILSKSNSVKAVYLSKEKIGNFIENNIEFYAVKGEARTTRRTFLTLKSLLCFLYKSLKLARSLKPTYIITQLTFSPIAVMIAKYLKIKCIMFLRSYEAICFKGFRKDFCEVMKCFSCTETIREKVFYPVIWIKTQWLRWAINNASLNIANSRFLRRIYKRYLNVDSEVIYPFIEFEQIISMGRIRKEYITFIKPKISKGLNIFIALAQKMPSRKFLAVGTSTEEDRPERLYNLRNVTYLGKVDDMREVYAVTRILLVPSIWPEPFGRVCVEAMANGIPCIASNVGGIKEAVGDAGILIDNPFDLNSWVKAIELLDDNGTYRFFSHKSREVMKKFNLDEGVNRFLKILRLSFRNHL